MNPNDYGILEGNLTRVGVGPVRKAVLVKKVGDFWLVDAPVMFDSTEHAKAFLHFCNYDHPTSCQYLDEWIDFNAELKNNRIRRCDCCNELWHQDVLRKFDTHEVCDGCKDQVCHRCGDPCDEFHGEHLCRACYQDDGELWGRGHFPMGNRRRR